MNKIVSKYLLLIARAVLLLSDYRIGKMLNNRSTQLMYDEFCDVVSEQKESARPRKSWSLLLVSFQLAFKFGYIGRIFKRVKLLGGQLFAGDSHCNCDKDIFIEKTGEHTQKY